MRYRLLGNTGEELSEIGFGTWQLGGISWVSPDDRTCISLLRQAFEAGVTVFDISPSYGNGRAERLLQRALGRNRNRIFISGKVGVLEDGTYHGFWSTAQLQESVDQSLKRLRTDHFDFLALHAPPMDVLKAGYALEFLHHLKQKGVARYVGVSLEAQPEEALIALEQGIDLLQIRFNMLFPEASKIFGIARERGVGLIANSPLAHGYLSGRYTCYDDVHEGDYPKGAFRASKPKVLVDRIIRCANACGALCNDNAPTLPNLAIKYVLSSSAIASTIPGHRSRSELTDNLRMSDGSYLTQSDLERAREIYRQTVLSSQRDAQGILA